MYAFETLHTTYQSGLPNESDLFLSTIIADACPPVAVPTVSHLTDCAVMHEKHGTDYPTLLNAKFGLSPVHVVDNQSPGALLTVMETPIGGMNAPGQSSPGTEYKTHAIECIDAGRRDQQCLLIPGDINRTPKRIGKARPLLRVKMSTTSPRYWWGIPFRDPCRGAFLDQRHRLPFLCSRSRPRHRWLPL